MSLLALNPVCIYLFSSTSKSIVQRPTSPLGSLTLVAELAILCKSPAIIILQSIFTVGCVLSSSF